MVSLAGDLRELARVPLRGEGHRAGHGLQKPDPRWTPALAESWLKLLLPCCGGRIEALRGRSPRERAPTPQHLPVATCPHLGSRATGLTLKLASERV